MDRRSDLAVHDVLPDLFPGFGESAPLDLPPLSARTEQEVCDLLVSGRFDAWSQALARVGNCAQPIRLRGRSETVDTTTGEIVSTYSSEQEPLGVTHVRCGNRRASECPSCSRLYAADMFQLIRAGVAGGKTVPESVAENPLVFATVTAPSFGPVHGRRDTGRRCHPHAGNEQTCEHGRPRTCLALHVEDDPALGQPLCGDCYDYASHLVWQWWAPDLWRRFTIALRRLVAKHLQVPANRLAEVATVQYAKVAEYQVRGAVHFHALVRLDGPRTPDGFAPAPTAVDATRLADLVRAAAASVRLTVPGVDARRPGTAPGLRPPARRPPRPQQPPHRRPRPRAEPRAGRRLPGQVRHQVGHRHRSQRQRPPPATPRHRTRPRRSAPKPPSQDSYELLGKWTHMLGFRGHFASKSRRYSVTLGALRRARRRAQALIAQSRAEGRPLDLAALEADLLAEDDTETTLVIGHWHYVGSGWNTEAERVLAIAAAARAREYAQWRAAQTRSSHGSEDRTT